MDNRIRDYYLGLDRGSKGRFLLWIQCKLEMSQSTALLRVKNDDWKTIEREVVEEGIADEKWKERP